MLNNFEPLTLTTSEKIRQKLKGAGVPFHANDNISDFIDDIDRHDLTEEVAEKFEEVLKAMVVDTDNDHNTKETAQRVAKMFIHEIFKGRYYPRPAITEFPNYKHLDELFVVGPATVRSACSHHFQSIRGKCWIGVLPDENSNLIGLSKFNRLVEWICARPSIQEETVVMLADELEKIIKPKGLAVIIQAEHLCMTQRGVRESSDCLMTNSVMRGLMHEDHALRSEFLSIIGGQGFRR